MLGMANRSDLSTRVTAVLDDRLRRGRAGFALAAGTVAAAALVVLTVAPVRAIAKQADERDIMKAKLAALEAEARAAQGLPGDERLIVLRKIGEEKAAVERRKLEEANGRRSSRARSAQWIGRCMKRRKKAISKASRRWSPPAPIRARRSTAMAAR